jgi:hypothetical protein
LFNTDFDFDFDLFFPPRPGIDDDEDSSFAMLRSALRFPLPLRVDLFMLTAYGEKIRRSLFLAVLLMNNKYLETFLLQASSQTRFKLFEMAPT